MCVPVLLLLAAVWASVGASPWSLAVCVRACVAGNGIGDTGATSLSEALKCCSELEELDLSRELLARLRCGCGCVRWPHDGVQ